MTSRHCRKDNQVKQLTILSSSNILVVSVINPEKQPQKTTNSKQEQSEIANVY